MMMNSIGIWTWQQVAQALAAQPPGTVLRVAKHQVEHPSASGLAPSVGLPYGQRADFRLRHFDCSGLHVRDFGAHYEAHLDQVHPECGVVDHLRRDAPGTYLAAATALGALAGTLLGKKPEAIFAGAAIGGLLAMLTADSPSDPQKDNTDQVRTVPAATWPGRPW